MKQQFIIKHGEYQAGRTVEFDNAELVSITMRKNAIKKRLDTCVEEDKPLLQDILYLLENITGPSANYVSDTPFGKPKWLKDDDKETDNGPY